MQKLQQFWKTKISQKPKQQQQNKVAKKHQVIQPNNRHINFVSQQLLGKATKSGLYCLNAFKH